MRSLAAVGRPLDQHRRKWRLLMLGNVASIGFVPERLDPLG